MLTKTANTRPKRPAAASSLLTGISCVLRGRSAFHSLLNDRRKSKACSEQGLEVSERMLADLRLARRRLLRNLSAKGVQEAAPSVRAADRVLRKPIFDFLRSYNGLEDLLDRRAARDEFRRRAPRLISQSMALLNNLPPKCRRQVSPLCKMIAKLFVERSLKRLELAESAECNEAREALRANLSCDGRTEWIMTAKESKHLPKPSMHRGLCIYRLPEGTRVWRVAGRHGGILNLVKLPTGIEMVQVRKHKDDVTELVERPHLDALVAFMHREGGLL